MGAVKVNPDGSITVGSIQEALELQGLILARQQEARPRLRKKSAAPVRVNGERPSEKVIKALKAVSGKEISSETLAKFFDLESTAALGPKIRHLANAFEKDGLKLSDYLESEVRERRGPRIWIVK